MFSTTRQRMKRAAALAVTLGFVGVAFAVAAPASADNLLEAGGSASDAYCVDGGAATDVEVYVRPATANITTYVSQSVDGTGIVTDFGGPTNANGSYSVTVPIAKQGTTVIQYGYLLPSGEGVFAGDRDFTFPEKCVVDPTPTPTPTPTETPTPEPTPTPTETPVPTPTQSAGPVTPSEPSNPSTPATGNTDTSTKADTSQQNTLNPAKTDAADLASSKFGINPWFAGSSVAAITALVIAIAWVARRRRGEQH